MMQHQNSIRGHDSRQRGHGNTTGMRGCVASMRLMKIFDVVVIAKQDKPECSACPYAYADGYCIVDGCGVTQMKRGIRMYMTLSLYECMKS